MRIAVNTISTKKQAGGAYQIAYNFLMETLQDQNGVEWYYITSQDVDDIVGEFFKELRGKRYFVFPNQPDFGGTYVRVKKELREWENYYQPDLIYSISSPCYFTFNTPEVLRFANAWLTNPNKEAWKSLTWKKRLRMFLYRINQKRMLSHAKYFITQSETVKKGLLQILELPENAVKVVPNVLPRIFAEAKVIKKQESGTIDVNCAAAPYPHKNLDIIPKVIKLLRDKYSIDNMRFHVTIPEENEFIGRIKQECNKNGTTDMIVNHGRCSQQQLIDIYNQCSICFLPSLLETFSASSLEAMYFGQYIVATDYEFNREIIGNSGVYYRPMDDKDAADKIAKIINNMDLQLLLKERMKNTIKKYNNYDKHYKGILDYLIWVAENNATGRDKTKKL